MDERDSFEYCSHGAGTPREMASGIGPLQNRKYHAEFGDYTLFPANRTMKLVLARHKYAFVELSCGRLLIQQLLDKTEICWLLDRCLFNENQNQMVEKCYNSIQVDGSRIQGIDKCLYIHNSLGWTLSQADTKLMTIDGLEVLSPSKDKEFNMQADVIRRSFNTNPMRMHEVREDDVSWPNTRDEEEFMSTRSVSSETPFYTAPNSSGEKQLAMNRLGLDINNPYAQLLASKQLWPVDPQVEQDWSGRGQHAQFQEYERNLINNLLSFYANIGHSSTSVVESVKCRRILLARKTIKCIRPFTKNQAVQEVANMTRLNHAHIVRVIGTYVVGKELSILMYPVAEHNLEVFLGNTNDVLEHTSRTVDSMERFFPCLSSAIHHIHNNGIKHMDIKPSNILVRSTKMGHKVYIADFGTARAYRNINDAETDGPTSFTYKYAAPEVCSYRQLGLSRGYSADIFSLGCVFLEIFATIWDMVYMNINRKVVQDLFQIVHKDGTGSYQANVDVLLKYWEVFVLRNSKRFDHVKWRIRNFPASPGRDLGSSLYFCVDLIHRMLSKIPQDRPTAGDLVHEFGEDTCCQLGRDELEVMSPNNS